jgi:hypothetical protein
MVSPLLDFSLLRQPGFQHRNGVQHRSALAAADADAWDVSVVGQLPQEAG